MERVYIGRALRGIWVALILTAACAFLYYTTPLVYPFLIAWAIAFLLNPLVNALHTQAKLPRWVAVTLSLIAFIGASGALLTVAITNIVTEIGYLVQIVQKYVRLWMDELIVLINSEFIQDIITQANTFYTSNPEYQDTIRTNLANVSKEIANLGTKLINVTFESVLKAVASLPNILAVTIIVLLATFFISKDWSRLLGFMSGLFPDATNRSARLIWNDLQKALFGYLRAQFILISITAAFVIVGLIVLRVDYAITIGLLIGLVDLLPYLGTGAVFVPWIIFCFVNENISLGIGLSILYSVIVVARQTLEPKVLASSIGLDPLATLIALVVGLNLLGVLGLIIGPVVLVILMAFYRAGVFRDIGRYVMEGKTRVE